MKPLFVRKSAFPPGASRPRTVPYTTIAVVVLAYFVGWFHGRVFGNAVAIVETTRELHERSASIVELSNQVLRRSQSVMEQLPPTERTNGQ